jgi:hypothetical protein
MTNVGSDPLGFRYIAAKRLRITAVQLSTCWMDRQLAILTFSPAFASEASISRTNEIDK